MDPNRIGLFDLAERRLAWADRRQTLLAQNIANADTPGWRARDVKSFSSMLADRAHTPGFIRTDPAHLAPRNPGPQAGQVQSGEKAPNGNNVRLDVELSRVADTEQAQSFTTGIYMKYLGLFRLASGK